jgi:hypothetical protein
VILGGAAAGVVVVAVAIAAGLVLRGRRKKAGTREAITESLIA